MGRIAVTVLDPMISPHFSPRFWKSGGSALPREGLCIDSPRAPKGRPNLAQAIGPGLQIASRPSPEGAVHKTDVQTVGGDESAIRIRIAASIGTPLQGLAHSLILETQADGLGWVSAPRWGLKIPAPGQNHDAGEKSGLEGYAAPSVHGLLRGRGFSCPPPEAGRPAENDWHRVAHQTPW